VKPVQLAAMPPWKPQESAKCPICSKVCEYITAVPYLARATRTHSLTIATITTAHHHQHRRHNRCAFDRACAILAEGGFSDNTLGARSRTATRCRRRLPPSASCEQR
jgi:hypothetical protein